MVTPRALSDRTNTKGTRKGVLVVLGQERRGIIGKRNFGPNHFMKASNALLEKYSMSYAMVVAMIPASSLIVAMRRRQRK